MDDLDRAQLPTPLPPRVWCDFNACGWSGDPDDDCYYVLNSDDLRAACASDGLSVLLFDWDDDTETQVLARLAQLESYRGRWRARPRAGFFVGPTPW